MAMVCDVAAFTYPNQENHKQDRQGVSRMYTIEIVLRSWMLTQAATHLNAAAGAANIHVQALLLRGRVLFRGAHVVVH